MYRNATSKLLDWKVSSHRKPLLFRGARQVGKTYLIQQFGKNEYENVVYVNFESTPQIASLFTQDLNPHRIVENLQFLQNTKINPEKTLIFFDEIQECAPALTSLKYFNEDANQYHVIAAGSLLGVKMARNNGFPVGKVNFLNLYPMSFDEFLLALNKKNLVDYMQTIHEASPLPEIFHIELIELLKRYFFVGGIPEAVLEYSKTQDVIKVREIQNDVLNAYTQDFAKHAPPNQIMKVTQIWNNIPQQLAKENKKFIFKNLHTAARNRDYEEAIQWLVDAGLTYKSSLIETPRYPLAHYADPKIFKLFSLDVGLLAAMTKLSSRIIIEGHQLFTEFHGALTENYVAQELLASAQTELYYWKNRGEAEIDFLLQYENHVLPLEVKAGSSTKSKSLQTYQNKYQPPLNVRASLKNLIKSGPILNCPLYFIHSLFRFCDAV